MSRKRKSKEKPSFFKILSQKDFSKLLRLPFTFLSRYGHLKNLQLPGNVKLRVDDDSGRSWNVKLEEFNNGNFCFSNGWKFFAEDAALKLGEFVVFTLIAKSEFDVVVYETSFCQREIFMIPTPASSSSSSSSSLLQDVKVESEGGIGANESEIVKRGKNCIYTYFKEGNPLYFETSLKKHHKSRITLPKKFSVASNMEEKKQVRVEKVGCSRRGASIAVDCRTWATHKYRVDLTKGWNQFRKANGLVDGKTCSFEFNPIDQVIYVKEVAPRPNN